MNRTININTVSHSRSTHHSLTEWLLLLAACLRYFFAQREVRMVSRLAFGGTAFMLMLGVVGSIECGTIAILPGALICLGLMGVAFLLLRGLGEEA